MHKFIFKNALKCENHVNVVSNHAETLDNKMAQQDKNTGPKHLHPPGAILAHFF